MRCAVSYFSHGYLVRAAVIWMISLSVFTGQVDVLKFRKARYDEGKRGRDMYAGKDAATKKVVRHFTYEKVAVAVALRNEVLVEQSALPNGGYRLKGCCSYVVLLHSSSMTQSWTCPRYRRRLPKTRVSRGRCAVALFSMGHSSANCHACVLSCCASSCSQPPFLRDYVCVGRSHLVVVSRLGAC